MRLWLVAALLPTTGSKKVVLSKARVYVEEGGTSTYTVVLDEAPASTLVVSPSLADGAFPRPRRNPPPLEDGPSPRRGRVVVAAASPRLDGCPASRLAQVSLPLSDVSRV